MSYPSKETSITPGYFYGSDSPSTFSTQTMTQLQETKRIYLFGHPISHSYSPFLQNTTYELLSLPWTYQLFESKSTPDFLDLLHAPNCVGSAVTMPHKVAIIPYLDRLLDEGRVIGAVNTIIISEETGQRVYTGTNTDCIGIRDALLSKAWLVPKPASNAGMVIGGGGTTRAAVYALNKYLGCSPIYLVNRDRTEVREVVEHFAGTLPVELIHLSSVAMADKISAPKFVVGAIPDFPPATPAEVTVREIATNVFAKDDAGVFLDMCYKPRWTTLLNIADRNGWKTVDGIQAMIGQGLAQVSIWSGIKRENIPDDKISRLLRDEVARKAQV
jgi:quinate dehydrogenase